MRKIFTLIAGIALAVSANAQITIAQVYGAGGNSGSVYNRDYVVLFNKTNSAVNISDWSLQYGSSGSTGNWSGLIVFPTGTTIAPYSYYLVGLASQSSTVGAVLPLNVDFDSGLSGGTSVNMAASNGKLALMNNATVINGSAPVGAIDFVGFGTANAAEGGNQAQAPAPNAANAIFRGDGGCKDTNNNSVDFTTGAPNPLNSTSAINNCSTLSTVEAITLKSTLVKNTFVKNNEINFGADAKDVKIFNMLGQVIKSASVKNNGTLDVSDLAKGNYIVTGTVNNQAVSQKILVD